MKDLPHLEFCPNYMKSNDPQLCVCEKYDEDNSLDEISEYLEDLFNDCSEPELLQWAEIITNHYGGR